MVNPRLSDEQKRKLRIAAAFHDMSMAEYVRHATLEAIERDGIEEKVPPQVREDLIDQSDEVEK